jgi:hypothetical protein
MQRRQVPTVIIAAVMMVMRTTIRMLRKWSGWRKDKSRVQQLMNVSVEECSGSFTTTGCDTIDRHRRDGRSYLNTDHSMTHWLYKRVIARKVS